MLEAMRYKIGLTFGGFTAASLFVAPAARADDMLAFPTVTLIDALTHIEQHETAALALTLGILVFAVLAAIQLVRTRSNAAAENADARTQITALHGMLDRANALLKSDTQVLVVWEASGEEAEIIGDSTIIAPHDAGFRVLAFATWLDRDLAQAMERAVGSLQEQGEGFTMALTTGAGRQIEAEGRAIGGRAVLRLREVSGVARKLGELAAEHRKLESEAEALRTLVEALPSPVWARNETGGLAFVNAAYARAVEADAKIALTQGTELFDRGAREELKLGTSSGTPYAKRLPAVVAGHRRMLDVLAVPTPHGSVGIGIDATEAEAMRAKVLRMIDAHRATLDQLATGVAIFDAQRRLAFYNDAYRGLWDLDAGFLDQSPNDSALLEHLRAMSKLPEETDFRQWRAQLHEAYQASDTREYEWHLPDGRTLRVVTTPNPEGGVTYLFDDVTEGLALKRQFDALIKVQSETLDNLGEAVAVFGSDGRLRLSNPAFAQLWRLDPLQLERHPHIETVIRWCRALSHADDIWDTLRSTVTALDERVPMSKRIENNDGSVVDCAALPLPDGATLVTFTDVSASVHVERALTERNEALVAAEKLKEAFLQHMSYELRSPLTNITGFAYFLGDAKTGPLNERQREYLGYITYSTNALLALVDNILDLATIDAGSMTLDLGQVDIRRSMDAAAEGVQDRLVKDGISLDIRVAPDIGSFNADERRIRQVLFNLLSNAVGFSPRGGKVTLTAERRADSIVFAVGDQGPGIPDDMKETVFEAFQSDPLGSRHRGVGLGLSLVRSFVKLHGGSVHVDSVADQGTTVVCVFPRAPGATRTAA